ncbi:HAMP domain-containing histidine kinase [Bacillus sp. DNRA2]|uniref:sensor histidine kinase n=1 Tax=Bacillus sp. DNRA2 TaxID=2723053 RepID=UPI00145DEB47|nr:HAMP domain-containing sensor histidine kinase [Bacillus sp. DNRA2]NMD69723.1 HAMP domain-containing histidine kinase [Bacillus sp. DNRA2]
MSIKLRLILSNLAMIIVPSILFCVAAGILSVLFLGDIKEVTTLLPESHSKDKVMQPDTQLYYELKEKSVVDPEYLLTDDYLSSVDERLKDINAGLIVRKNNDILFSSNNVKLVKQTDLPPFGTTTIMRNLEKVGERTFAIKQHDYYQKDGSEISLFVMKDASPWNHFVKTFFPILIGLCLLSLVATNGLLTFFVSRSIIQPISRLKAAAQSIKNGHFDHSISPEKKDEIGELTQMFEEMRLKLNESFAIQKQYEENRKELIAHISHDLKTPITSIKGYVEGLRDGVADTPEKQSRYIQTIYAKSFDLDRLIDELFLFSKLDLGKLPFEFEMIDLKNYLSDFIEELSFDLEEKGVLVSFTADDYQTALVKIDRDKFKRVLANIVTNSVKYMDKVSKELKFTLCTDSNKVELAIADNGPGINEESLPYIFEQFYRADQSRSQLTGGSGLGLSIARMIVEGHNGSIKAESEEGLGTKITITLPIEMEAKQVK